MVFEEADRNEQEANSREEEIFAQKVEIIESIFKPPKLKIVISLNA